MSRPANLLRRLAPRRLAGQIILLLLLALVLSQGATLAFFLYERQEAVRSVTREQVLLRVAATVHVLDETPRELHRRVVRGANAPLLRFWLSRNSAVRAHCAAHQTAARRSTVIRFRKSFRASLAMSVEITSDLRRCKYDLSRSRGISTENFVAAV